jgi:DNA-binding response OmpR family regulator
MEPISVVLLTDDLMFGSKVESMIRAAGADPVLAAAPLEALAAIERLDARLLIVDLVSDGFDGTTLPAAAGVPVVGYYAHTDDDTRRAALAAGFDTVVPRSRMMREGDALIASILGR